MRALISFLAYVVTLLLVAAVSFVVVIAWAGPHAGLLPRWVEVGVLGLGWVAVLVVPVMVARMVWRRYGAQPPNHSLQGRRP